MRQEISQEVSRTKKPNRKKKEEEGGDTMRPSGITKQGHATKLHFPLRRKKEIQVRKKRNNKKMKLTIPKCKNYNEKRDK